MERYELICFSLHPDLSPTQVRPLASAVLTEAPEPGPDVRPKGDFNFDGCIDQSDQATLLAVLRGALSDSELIQNFDLTGDGQVNLDNLRELVKRYSRPEGAPCV